MYFSGRAEVTSGEMREAEKRGPRVEWDRVSSPVVAAGDCHMMAPEEEGNWEGGGYVGFVCAESLEFVIDVDGLKLAGNFHGI